MQAPGPKKLLALDAIRTYLPSTRLPQSPQILSTRKPRSYKIFK